MQFQPEEQNEEIKSLAKDVVDSRIARIGGQENLKVDFFDWLNQGIDQDLISPNNDLITTMANRVIKRNSNSDIGLLGSYYSVDQKELEEINTIELPYASIMIVVKSFESYAEMILDTYTDINGSCDINRQNRSAIITEIKTNLKEVIGEQRLERYQTNLEQWLKELLQQRIDLMQRRPQF